MHYCVTVPFLHLNVSIVKCFSLTVYCLLNCLIIKIRLLNESEVSEWVFDEFTFLQWLLTEGAIELFLLRLIFFIACLGLLIIISLIDKKLSSFFLHLFKEFVLLFIELFFIHFFSSRLLFD